MENVIILGTGVAGLTAAIYTARASLAPLVIGGPEEGGQLTLTTDVENFPGFPDSIKGPELVENCKKQAARFGAKYLSAVVVGYEHKKDHHELTLDDGKKLMSKTLIIATGASARWMGIESEVKYKGRGVSTCATCDGYFYKGKEVVVIGGGDSAMEESNFLSKFANKITVVHRKDSLRASKIMQDRFFANPKCSIVWDSEIAEVLGDGKKVSGVKVKNIKTSKTIDIKCDGVFLAIGHVPNTKPFEGKLELDEKGYLKTDRRMKTNIPGVFGAGDVQDIIYRQAITAAGTGCQAAMEAEKYLESLGH
ncbi:MAG TPA: thioredoxin-disulfide reductase [Candidatus Nanoarchaeia archaeon]|nr:thioredoxin-disulfide reductase [Candidatus Nanoarchaeia archaeon]